jgi:hypothetical protein
MRYKAQSRSKLDDYSNPEKGSRNMQSADFKRAPIGWPLVTLTLASPYAENTSKGQFTP